jgi:uncharacterized protein (DUF1778 family)
MADGKAGAPKRDPKTVRSSYLRVLLTEDEKELLDRLALEAGMSISDFIRMMIFEGKGEGR